MHYYKTFFHLYQRDQYIFQSLNTLLQEFSIDSAVLSGMRPFSVCLVLTSLVSLALAQEELAEVSYEDQSYDYDDLTYDDLAAEVSCP